MRAVAVIAGVVVGFGAGFLVAVLTVPDWAPWLAVVGAGVLGTLVARVVPRSDRSRRRAAERDRRVADYRR